MEQSGHIETGFGIQRTNLVYIAAFRSTGGSSPRLGPRSSPPKFFLGCY